MPARLQGVALTDLLVVIAIDGDRLILADLLAAVAVDVEVDVVLDQLALRPLDDEVMVLGDVGEAVHLQPSLLNRP